MSQDFFILLKNECDFISVFVIDTQEKLPSIFIFYVNPPSSKSPCDGRLVHSENTWRELFPTRTTFQYWMSWYHWTESWRRHRKPLGKEKQPAVFKLKAAYWPIVSLILYYSLFLIPSPWLLINKGLKKHLLSCDFILLLLHITVKVLQVPI